MHVWDFGPGALNYFRISCFGFRISDFGPGLHAGRPGRATRVPTEDPPVAGPLLERLELPLEVGQDLGVPRIVHEVTGLVRICRLG